MFHRRASILGRGLWLIASAALALACSSSDSETVPHSTAPPGPPEWNRQVTPPSDTEAAMQRSACAYQAGSLPAETQGKSDPNGSDIPIDTIIVLMMENRSFDHYFQKLPEYGQPDVEVAPPTYTNPDATGAPVAPFHGSQYCFVDTNHSWAGAHTSYADGKMNGFFAANDGWDSVPPGGMIDQISGKRALAYYDQTDIPFYYWLANEFAIADHYHCSLLGPTWPNRQYMYGASSYGDISGAPVAAPAIIVDNLEKRQVDWTLYGDGFLGMSVFLLNIQPYLPAHRRTIDQFFADAAAGTLPHVAFVDPILGMEQYDQNDEHPPAIMQIGELFAAKIIDALMKSPSWSRSALFLTYDEHGGLFDHVPPPPACPPDAYAPKVGAGDPPGAFDRLGVRVPLIVVSPYAKKHFVGHHTYDHTSILRFIEARFVMPAMTNRDANAEAPWEMFDFANPPHAQAPTGTLPTVNPDNLAACKQLFAP